MDEHLHIVITGEHQGFLNALKGAQDGVRATSREIEKSGMSIEQMFGRIKQAAALSLAGFSAKEFAQKVITIRGEFQKLEVAFNTMLGSAEKANALMQQLTKTAAITPFDLQGVTNGAKQLLAYGIEAEKVNDTLVHLGDIAAGLSLPLTDLVYLYGTTMVQGRMFTRDLLQFQNRGIPIAEELAKVLGVTKDKVGELITAGKVGAKEFNAAIMAMSSEGGKFGGLMEAQSKTITGQISNIEDAIDVMFNNIGKSSEGIINDTLSVISSLVENYEKVGRVIVSLVGVYGTYKTAVMLYCAVQKVHTTWLALEQTAHLQNALATNVEIAAKGRATAATVLLDKAQKMLNATMLANPYVLAATAIAGLVAVMMNMKSEQDLVNDATERYNKERDEAIAKEEEHKRKIDELCQIAGDETLSTDTRREAMLKLKKEYPDLFKKYNTEIEALKDIYKWKAAIAELDGKKSLKLPENELTNVNQRIKALQAKGARTIETDDYGNPTGWAGRTEEEEGELKSLLQTQKALNAKINEGKRDEYLHNLTGISNEDLQAQINERRNLLAKMTMQEQQGKKNHSTKGRISFGGAAGTYSRKEIEDQLKTFEWEQNRRKQVISDGSKDFVAEAQKAYKKEEAELKKLRALTDPAKRAKSKMTVELGGKDVKVSEMSSDQLSDAIAKQKQKTDDAAKKLEKLTGQSVKSSNKKAEEEAERDATRRQKMFDAQQREEEAQAGQRLQTRRAQTAANIAQIKNDALRQRAEEDNQYEQDKEALNERIKEYKQKNLELAKARFDAENTDKKKVWADTKEAKGGWQKQNLTKEQQAEVDAERAKIEAEYQRIVNNRYKSELQSMRDFLKEYGTLEQRRVAIAEEYAEKIKEAEEAGLINQAALLKRQAEEADNSIIAEQMRQDINFDAIFSDLLDYDTDFLNTLQKQLETVIKDGIEKGIDATDMKVFGDKLQEVKDIIAQKSGSIFGSNGILGGSWAGNINQQIQKQRGLEETARAKREEADRLKIKSQQADFEKSQAGLELQNAIDVFDKDSEQAGKAMTKFEDATSKAGKAQLDFTKADKEAEGAVSAVASNGQAMGLAITDAIIHGVNDNIQSMSTMVNEWGIGGEDFQKSVAEFAESSQYATQAFDSLKQGDVFGTIYNLGEAFNSLGESFGIWTNSNVEESEREIKERENANKELVKALQDLTEAFKNSDFSSGVKTYEKALSVLNAQIANGAQAVGVKFGEYNGHHSTNYYGGYATSLLNEMARRANAAGYISNTKQASDLNAITTTFTPEELDKIRSFDPSGWTKFIQEIRNADKADLGSADTFVAFVDEYADAVKDLERQWKETITGLSWDSLKSSFASAMKDMTKTVEDWQGDVDDILRENVANYISAGYTSTDTSGGKQAGKLAQWYDKLAAYTESAGIDAKEAAELRKEYLEIQEAASAERDQWYSMLGLDEKKNVSDSEAAGSIHAAQGMSEDTANEMVGRITATQIAVETFKVQEQASNAVLSTQLARCITTLDVIASGRTDYSGVLNDILFQHVLGNQYLEDIAGFNKKMYEEWGGQIRAIRNKIDTL